MHYIKVKTVNEILLKSIKEIIDVAKEEKQEFLKVMNKLSDEKREEKYQGYKEKLGCVLKLKIVQYLIF